MQNLPNNKPKSIVLLSVFLIKRRAIAPSDFYPPYSCSGLSLIRSCLTKVFRFFLTLQAQRFSIVVFRIHYYAGVVSHPRKSSHLARVAALQMGRGSGSPPGPPHNHTDSEQESMSWSLQAWTPTQKQSATI